MIVTIRLPKYPVATIEIKIQAEQLSQTEN